MKLDATALRPASPAQIRQILLESLRCRGSTLIELRKGRALRRILLATPLFGLIWLVSGCGEAAQSAKSDAAATEKLAHDALQNAQAVGRLKLDAQADAYAIEKLRSDAQADADAIRKFKHDAEVNAGKAERSQLNLK